MSALGCMCTCIHRGKMTYGTIQIFVEEQVLERSVWGKVCCHRPPVAGRNKRYLHVLSATRTSPLAQGNTYCVIIVTRILGSEPRHIACDENVLLQQGQSAINNETPGKRPASPKLVVTLMLNNTSTKSAVFGLLVPLPNAPICNAIAWCVPTVTARLPLAVTVKLHRN
jgi:hypothetical protein